MTSSDSPAPPHRPPPSIGARRTMAVSLAVSIVAPPLLYTLLTASGVGDFAALSCAAAVPPLWTVASWIVRRRVDWVGAVATAGYAVTWLLSLLLGGSTLLLKLHGALITAPLGLALLVSAAIGRPLLGLALRVVVPDPARAAAVASRLANPAAQKKLTLATAIAGALLVLHAALTTALAVAFPTEAFLIGEKVATWSLVAAALLFVAMRRRRAAP